MKNNLAIVIPAYESTFLLAAWDSLSNAVDSFVDVFKFCLDFLTVGLAAWNEVLEEHNVIDYFDVVNEEGPMVAYAYAVNILVADKFLAIGDFR